MRSRLTTAAPATCWAALALALVVIAFRFVAGSPIDTNIQSVLPRPDSATAVDLAIEQSSTALSGRVAFLVSAPTAEIAQQAASDLETRLTNVGLYRPALEEGEETARWLFANRDELLCIPSDEFDAATARQTQRQALAQIYSPTGAVNSDLLRADPFLRTLQLAQCLSPPLPAGGSPEHVLVSGRLTQSAYALDAQAAMQQEVRDFTEQWSGQGVELARTGSIFFAASAADQARTDVTRIGALGSVGVIALFLFAFLRLRAAIAALAVVAYGLTIGIGATLLVFSSVNVLVFVFAAMLVGIASDYAIHALATGPATQWAAPETRRRLLMRPTAVSLVTTILGFAALAFFGIPLLQQVAVMAGAGLFAAWVFVLFIVVPLDKAPASPDRPIRHWNRLAALRERARLPTVAAIAPMIIVAGMAAYGATRLAFVDDVRTFQARPADLLADEAELAQAGVDASSGAFLYTEASDGEQARDHEAAALRILPDNVAVLALSRFDPSVQSRASARATLDVELYQPFLGDHVAQLGLEPDPLPASRDASVEPPSWFAALSGQARQRTFLSAPITSGALPDGAKVGAAVVVDPVERYSRAFAAYRGYAGWALLAALAGAACVVIAVYRKSRALVIVLCPALALVAAILAPAAFGVPVNFFTLAAGLVLLGVGLDYAAFEWEAGETGDRWTSLAVTLDAITTILSMGLLLLSTTIPVQSFGLTIAIGVTLALSLSGLARIAGRTSPA